MSEDNEYVKKCKHLLAGLKRAKEDAVAEINNLQGRVDGYNMSIHHLEIAIDDMEKMEEENTLDRLVLGFNNSIQMISDEHDALYEAARIIKKYSVEQGATK